jgi:G:T-mismatch repair DNA endonuclease (very short patch repair protein)
MSKLQGVWTGSLYQLKNLRKVFTEVGTAYYGSEDALFEDGDNVLNKPALMVFWLGDFGNQFSDPDNSASDTEDSDTLAKKCFRAVKRYRKYVG